MGSLNSSNKNGSQLRKESRQGCVLSSYLFNVLAEMVMRETLNGFNDGLQIGGRMITNLCYADDIILLATQGQNYKSWWIV